MHAAKRGVHVCCDAQGRLPRTAGAPRGRRRRICTTSAEAGADLQNDLCEVLWQPQLGTHALLDVACSTTACTHGQGSAC
jgi:hypothetical protein